MSPKVAMVTYSILLASLAVLPPAIIPRVEFDAEPVELTTYERAPASL